MATLVIRKRSTSVKIESDHLVVHHHERDTAAEAAVSRVPLAEVERVIVLGQPAITFPVLVRLMEKGIPCSFLSKTGRWRDGIGFNDGYFALRRMRQYERVRDEVFSLRVARHLIAAKIANGRRVIQRLLANRGQKGALEVREHQLQLNSALAGIHAAESLGVARGIEGFASAHYFAALGHFFPEAMPFAVRTRRPPKDEANALLSWTYSILLQEMIGCIRSHGLDVSAGVLHANRDRSPSLALDLIEPLRTGCCDLLVLNMVNHRIIRPGEHFRRDEEDGGVHLNEDGQKAFFQTYEQAMHRKFILPETNERVDMRRVIDLQVCRFLKMMETNADMSFFTLP